MFNTKTLDEIATNIANVLPPSLNAVKDDLEKSFRAILQATLSKLDLVTREEFEVQKLVLAKTRANLDALEKRVALLEHPLTPPAE